METTEPKNNFPNQILSERMNTSVVDIGQKSVLKEEKNTKAIEMSERQILKNVLLLSLTFSLIFTSFYGLSYLQSSLHIQQGMGVVNHSILYGALLLSAIFLPRLTIHFLGHKWTLAFSIIGYILWMVANGYGVWGTMVPASILVGLCASPMWTAKCAYLSSAAKKYAEIRGESVGIVNARFFGIFFGIFKLSGIARAVIQTTVLKQGTPENVTGPVDEEIALCGLNDCPWNNITNKYFEKPSPQVLWTLVCVYIGLSVIAFIIVAVFIDKLPNSWLSDDDSKGSVRKRIFSSMGATLLHLRHVNQILIIPLTIYSGLQTTFYSSELFRSYITCNLGMWMISLVTLPNALTNATTCFTTGRIVKYIGVLPVFITGMVVDMGLQFTLLFWKPHPDQMFMFFLLPMFHGVSDGVLQTQVNALYGTLFPMDMEAAFCNYRLWEAVGMVAAYAWSSVLCTSVKLYITMAFFYLGAILLFALYAKMHREGGNAYPINEVVIKNEPSEKYTEVNKTISLNSGTKVD